MSNAQLIVKYKNVGEMRRRIEQLKITNPKSRELRNLERYVNTFFNCVGIINACGSCTLDKPIPLVFSNGRGDFFLPKDLSPAHKEDWYDAMQLLYELTENEELRERFLKLLRDNNHEYQWVTEFEE